MMSQSFDGK